jgi:UDP-N-acetylmuramate dehydrogenase
MISDKHGGFIVNTGNAKAEDVIFLINFIKKKVFESYGLELETEIEIVEDSIPQFMEAQQS